VINDEVACTATSGEKKNDRFLDQEIFPHACQIFHPLGLTFCCPEILLVGFSLTWGLLQSVRMKDIQNEIIISQKEFIIHINGLHHNKRKLQKFFSAYKTFSIN
jgi:hypothetical protein